MRADVLLLLSCCLRRIDRASGEVVERYRYTPFGEVAIEDDQGSALPESAFGNDRFFLRRPFDALTGHYDLRARWYDPTSDSFLAPDPLGPVDSWNLYQYGFGSPATWMDPWGLQMAGLDTEEFPLFPVEMGMPGPYTGTLPGPGEIAHELVWVDPYARPEPAGDAGLGKLVAFIASVLPLIGDANDICVIATGYDPINGEQVGALGRAVTVFALFIGSSKVWREGAEGVGRAFRRGVRDAVEDAARRGARTTPRNLAEKLTLDEAKGGAGKADHAGEDQRSEVPGRHVGQDAACA